VGALIEIFLIDVIFLDLLLDELMGPRDDAILNIAK